jgi:DNA-binding IclR family transcriptional regulator
MTFRLGATLPLRKSAVGHVFLAYMPEAITARLLQEQNEDGDVEEDQEALRPL